MTKNIVLLHGWGGSKKSLKLLEISLKELGYKAITLEMPGHGSTREMRKAWDMNDFAEWCKKKIKNEELKNYILLGHSFGGKIILEGLKSGKLDPQAIVLIDTNGIKPRNSVKKTFWKVTSELLKIFQNFPGYEEGREFVYKKLIREQDYLKTKENLKKSFQLFNEQHYNDFIKKIEKPTLILWGKNDRVTPLWMGKLLHEKIKGSKFITFDETHGLPLKKPLEVASVINEFIKNL